MNLKSKNGEDVLTLDAAERRCGEKWLEVCRTIKRVCDGEQLGEAGFAASENTAYILKVTETAK